MEQYVNPPRWAAEQMPFTRIVGLVPGQRPETSVVHTYEDPGSRNKDGMEYRYRIVAVGQAGKWSFDLPPFVSQSLPFSVGPVNASDNRQFVASIKVGSKPQTLNLQVLDAAGQSVKEMTLKRLRNYSEALTINMAGFPAGRYVLVVDNGSGKFRRGFVLE